MPFLLRWPFWSWTTGKALDSDPASLTPRFCRTFIWPFSSYVTILVVDNF